MELIWFMLAAFGLTQILVYGTIFDNYRPHREDFKGWGEVFHCPMCMGFWVGAFLFGINGLTELFSFDSSVTTALLLGCLSSATSYVLNVIFGDEGIRVEHTGIPRKAKINYRRWK